MYGEELQIRVGKISVFENILMALHNLSSLESMNSLGDEYKYSCVRSAIVAWYYGVYGACKAMIAAQDGSNPEVHAKTAQLWGDLFSSTNLVPDPFNLYVPTLVKQEYEEVISSMRDGNAYDLARMPTNNEEAFGAVLAYLNGTAKWYREREEQKIKQSREFKVLGVDNFRTNVARNLRDSKLRNRSVNFMHQAFRYRGKANYRDSLYLSYGRDSSDRICGLISDLQNTLSWLLKISLKFSSRRIQESVWNQFEQDFAANSRICVSVTPSL